MGVKYINPENIDPDKIAIHLYTIWADEKGGKIEYLDKVNKETGEVTRIYEQ